MPNRNFSKNNDKRRKNSGNQQKRFKQKQQNAKWECRICQSLNENTCDFCVQCYVGLHYYAYVNMHMFVASDNSYQQIYYQTKTLDTSMDSISLNSNDGQSQSESEAEDVKIDWVESLLQDE